MVAKLKAIFDRFDSSPSTGLLSGAQVEQALIYMNRPIDSAAVCLFFYFYDTHLIYSFKFELLKVNEWLLRLKDNNIEITFPEFVGQYSSLFAGSDPGKNNFIHIFIISFRCSCWRWKW